MLEPRCMSSWKILFETVERRIELSRNRLWLGLCGV
uniref:Uncharacterized protein n=1 Tax=Rhizophora mucronata TaxID=61149 RepID=A0A2P2P310_RHIMU